AVLPSGDLIAGGRFNSSIGHGVSRWNGSSWGPLGSGLGGPFGAWADALVVMPNGDLIAAGNFTTAGGVPASNIARWNGSAWAALGSGINGEAHALVVLPGGVLAAAGLFNVAGGSSVHYLASWN